MGKVRSAVFAFLGDHEGETFAADAVVKKKEVTGKAEHIRRALDLVAAAEPHVFKDPNPKRAGAWVYSYSATRDSNPRGLGIGGTA